MKRTVARGVPIALLSSIGIAACTDVQRIAAPEAPEAAATLTKGSVPDSVFNRYIVVFRDDVPSSARLSEELTARLGGSRFHVYEHAIKGFAVANLSAAAVAALRQHPRVLFVEEDVPQPPAAVQNLPQNSDAQWGLDRIDQRAGTFRNWDYKYNYFLTGAGTHIYIVDSGIASAHQEFAGRIGNGATRLSWSWNADPYHDQDGHGTNAAALAAGTTYGVAKAAILHSVRINDNGDAWSSDIAAGLDWVAANAIRPAVANLSYRTRSSTIATAMRGVVSAGITMVTSADNDNQDACNNDGNRVAGVIVVAAAARDDTHFTGVSNFGSCVDLYAPGERLLTAGTASTTDAVYRDGTSMAAPLVTGVAALVLQQGSGADSYFVEDVR